MCAYSQNFLPATVLTMYPKEEDEQADHKSNHWLSAGGAAVGGTLVFFSHILLDLNYGKLVWYTTMWAGVGVGGFIGYVLDDIWVHRQPKKP